MDFALDTDFNSISSTSMDFFVFTLCILLSLMNVVSSFGGSLKTQTMLFDFNLS